MEFGSSVGMGLNIQISIEEHLLQTVLKALKQKSPYVHLVWDFYPSQLKLIDTFLPFFSFYAESNDASDL